MVLPGDERTVRTVRQCVDSQRHFTGKYIYIYILYILDLWNAVVAIYSTLNNRIRQNPKSECVNEGRSSVEPGQAAHSYWVSLH